VLKQLANFLEESAVKGRGLVKKATDETLDKNLGVLERQNDAKSDPAMFLNHKVDSGAEATDAILHHSYSSRVYFGSKTYWTWEKI